MTVDLYPWVVLLHILGAFAFAAGHGVSVFVAFRLRAERDPARMRALLDLSSASLGMAGIGLLALLVGGVAAGAMGGWFGRGWIWVSLVLLLVVGGLMTPLGGTYFRRLREALAAGPQGESPAETPAPAGPGHPLEALGSNRGPLEALVSNRRPELLAVLGGGGFVAILALMVLKPF